MQARLPAGALARLAPQMPSKQRNMDCMHNRQHSQPNVPVQGEAQGGRTHQAQGAGCRGPGRVPDSATAVAATIRANAIHTKVLAPLTPKVLSMVPAACLVGPGKVAGRSTQVGDGQPAR